MLHLVINCGENHPSCEAVDFRRSGTFMYVHSVVIHQVWYCIIFNKQILVVVTLHLR